MDTTELINNQFRMVQTREKLKRDGIKNQRDAIETHEAVAKEVRTAIVKIGGTLPENIPPAEHVKQVEKRLKTSKPRLDLDPKDPLGIADHSDSTGKE
jgi:DNA-damage-inducible protein D